MWLRDAERAARACRMGISLRSRTVAPQLDIDPLGQLKAVIYLLQDSIWQFLYGLTAKPGKNT